MWQLFGFGLSSPFRLAQTIFELVCSYLASLMCYKRVMCGASGVASDSFPKKCGVAQATDDVDDGKC